MASNFFKYTDNDGVQHIITGDLVESADDTRETELTQWAVESGAQVSDHVVRKQDTANFELLQSQTPIYGLPGEETLFTSAEVTVSRPGVPGKIANLSTEVSTPTNPPKLSPLQVVFPPLVTQAVDTGNIGQQTIAVRSTQAVDTGNNPTVDYKFHAFQASDEVDRIRDMHNRLLELLDNSYLVDITFRGYTLKGMVLTGCKSSSQAGELGIGRFSLKFAKLNTVTTAKGEDLPDPNERRLKAARKKAAQDKKDAADAEKAKGETLASRIRRATGVELTDFVSQ